MKRRIIAIVIAMSVLMTCSITTASAASQTKKIVNSYVQVSNTALAAATRNKMGGWARDYFYYSYDTKTKKIDSAYVYQKYQKTIMGFYEPRTTKKIKPSYYSSDGKTAYFKTQWKCKFPGVSIGKVSVGSFTVQQWTCYYKIYNGKVTMYKSEKTKLLTEKSWAK